VVVCTSGLAEEAMDRWDWYKPLVVSPLGTVDFVAIGSAWNRVPNGQWVLLPPDPMWDAYLEETALETTSSPRMNRRRTSQNSPVAVMAGMWARPLNSWRWAPGIRLARV